MEGYACNATNSIQQFQIASACRQQTKELAGSIDGLAMTKNLRWSGLSQSHFMLLLMLIGLLKDDPPQADASEAK